MRWILICVVIVHFNKAVVPATVGVSIIKICFILVATLFSDRLSRQLLLHASTAGVAVSMVSLGMTLCVVVASAASMGGSVLSARPSWQLSPSGLGHWQARTTPRSCRSACARRVPT